MDISSSSVGVDVVDILRERGYKGIRFAEGEKLALRELAKPELERKEIVALCVEYESAEGEHEWFWIKLDNRAKEPWKSFEVRIDNLAGMNLYPVCLWHSHYVGANPSGVDLAEYPTELLGTDMPRGVVFDAQSRVSSVYDSTGVAERIV